MSWSVPTVALRERLDAAIAELQPQTRTNTETSGSRLRAWLGTLVAPFAFAPRQAVGFASLLAVVSFAVIFAIVYSKNSTSELAKAVRPAAQLAVNTPEFPEQKRSETTSSSEDKTATSGIFVSPDGDGNKQLARKQNGERNESGGWPTSPFPQPAVARKDVENTLLPGEKSYLTAIASLTTTLENSSDISLKPSLRVEYERNLAVVDQAIETTRRAARSDPRDEDAANFLLSAYQSKVELLSTVADQARLTASAR